MTALLLPLDWEAASLMRLTSCIAQILGKDFWSSQTQIMQIIGQALSGTPNQYSLPGATQTDATKVQQIADVIMKFSPVSSAT